MAQAELKKVAQADLKVGEKVTALPVVEGTEGERAVDVTALRAATGLVTLDTGYMNTGACRSAITFLDGEKGILRYRGYPIEILAERASFLETSYLLIFGELPTARQLEAFRNGVTRHTMLHEDLKRFYDAFPRDAHPMALLSAVVCSMSTFYQDSLDPSNPQDVELSTYRLIGKIATIAAYSYKKSIGHPFVYPDNALDYAANFLRMMFSVPAEEYEINPVIEKAMDRILMLHADHEQNASTSTVRLAGSSGANPFACIAAGIASLWGPSHGGANEAVINMLNEIGGKQNIPGFLSRVKDKQDHTRLMGFGHRVYKNYDPRAKVMRQTCHEVLTSLGIEHDPLLELAMEMEQIALKDDYFVSKKLYPNVDFYSGIIFRAIGIPTSMFTVLFAVARTVGWISQWNEMIEDPDQKIGRPRQLYNGQTERPYKPLHMRG